MMNDPQPEFEPLQQLLKCKRYEQPPPGYFFSFSDQVIARLEEEQSARAYSSWWAWLVARFDAKPVLVCAYTLVVSSLLIAGFRLSQFAQGDSALDTAGLGGGWLAVTPGSPSFGMQETRLSAFQTSSPLWHSAPGMFAREESSRLLFAKPRVQAAGLFLPAGQ